MPASCAKAACRSRPARTCARSGISGISSPAAASPIRSPTSPIAAASPPFMKIAHLAEAFNLPVTSHGAHDVTVHLLAAAPNRSYLEAHGFGLDRYIAEPLRIEEGFAIAPIASRPRHRVRLEGPGGSPGLRSDGDREAGLRLHRRRRRLVRLRRCRAAGLRRRARACCCSRAATRHRHPLLDMPPGIFKMINGSKFMRYHQTVPQEHLDGRVHDIPQGNVLGGGSSVNAQVYMRGRALRLRRVARAAARRQRLSGLELGRRAAAFPRHGRQQPAAQRAARRDGPLLVSDPGHINEVSRWFVQSVQALGVPYNHDFNGPSQRGVGFYQFMNRQRQTQQRGLCLPRARSKAIPNLDGPAQRARAPHRDRERRRGRRHLSRRQGPRAPGLRRRARSSSPPARWSRRSC